MARKRLGAKSAESIALSTPGMLEATEALEMVQIDHTLADVMIVDSVYRRSIGRPWLSLAIDVATRSVLGFQLGLEAPSALAVALCIEHAVLPKIRSAAAPTTETSWDMFGMPRDVVLEKVANPKVRGAALWTAHAFTWRRATWLHPTVHPEPRLRIAKPHGSLHPLQRLVAGAATGVLAALVPPRPVDRGTRIDVNRSAQYKLDINC